MPADPYLTASEYKNGGSVRWQVEDGDLWLVGSKPPKAYISYYSFVNHHTTEGAAAYRLHLSTVASKLAKSRHILEFQRCAL